ncbi:VOC family protein [Demequina sp. SYSU T00039]|uniref:VOC family protein n=1 Tax=Demequina lignilytica TaxID=3051663 RepID=A0AAW7M1S0_9MICO|nr:MULTISPECIES: VOC family protein [unclassified Demequina]MDN4477251.1 VOC family protein [Demequina sp. SYSU T00039-1]MDN4487424.1 VOC family protein [Demequina sp. SYSU T00039]MDN4491177.1 VOC family protein [Demequina sp. SYSU T00068]
MDATAVACFSTDSVADAKEFYAGTLGIDVSELATGTLVLNLAGGSHVFIYEKEDHAASNYTTLILAVADVRATVRDLASKGVQMAPLPGTDDEGVAQDEDMPPTAWFTDPAGNWVAIGEMPGVA